MLQLTPLSPITVCSKNFAINSIELTNTYLFFFFFAVYQKNQYINSNQYTNSNQYINSNFLLMSEGQKRHSYTV